MEKNALLKANQKIEGVGLGLRFPHFDDILNHKGRAPWYEVITEDFIEPGPHHKKLLQLRNSSPIVLHSIGLNVGGVQKFNEADLKAFKEIYNKFQPEYISDHLCWSAHNGAYHHDLLPIPYTKEGLKNVIERVDFLQNYFKRPLALENITSYIDHKAEDYTEINFIKKLCEATGCKLLLDITNVIINHKNRKTKDADYFKEFPMSEVIYCHVSGTDSGADADVMIDTHNAPVSFNEAQIITDYNIAKPILLERDANIPSFKELEFERHAFSEKIYGI